MDASQDLREFSLFRDLSEEELGRVAHLAILRQFDRGDTIFIEGTPREAVFFIVRGLVKVEKVDEEGREHIVAVLGKGQMFPHVGFFQDRPYPGTARAIEPTAVYAISTSAFDALLRRYPPLAIKLLRVLADRIVQLQAKLQELAVYDSRQRVVAFLRHFAEEHGVPTPEGIRVHLPVTHAEIAQAVGLRRESVNRIWNQLRREGVVEGERDPWLVHLDQLE
ncbi:Crp/Fnr family transcriptional regulator [Alicyclobacillus fructus]|uniref:Crp/Fnr family transcriptional regulator n=1 Tax=Alicyclobacillus fructus TaxID=2816082 RepID=UPI001A8C2ED0|nr:Crp/Fnr family transcriptional regulator [Alicyclobacillus fructus]